MDLNIIKQLTANNDCEPQLIDKVDKKEDFIFSLGHVYVNIRDPKSHFNRLSYLGIHSDRLKLFAMNKITDLPSKLTSI